MASFRKLPSGLWRAEIFRRGVRRSASFPTKQAAKDWAAREEHLILTEAVNAPRKPLADVLTRYAREVSPTHKGERWEVLRLARIGRDRIGKIPVADLTAVHLADWRDRRLREVSSASVAREMQLLSAVLSVARREWGLIRVNPASEVRKPKLPPGRDRLPTQAELDRLAIAAGPDLSVATARAFHAFLFAIETGMRAGEIAGLTWDRVDLTKQVARLPMTKNGHARDVPLSREAVRLLEALPRLSPVFGMSAHVLSALFRKVAARAGVEGLRLHDSRHAAITQLAKKLDILSLARMVGHRNLSMLQRYFNETAEDMAKRLD